MYYICKKVEVSGSHHLLLNYKSKCAQLHGHNWQIEVFCKSEELDKNGMVVDFSTIADVVRQLDHHNINEVINGNPTSENMARWICERVPHCYKVSVQETSGNVATYEIDE